MPDFASKCEGPGYVIMCKSTGFKCKYCTASNICALCAAFPSMSTTSCQIKPEHRDSYFGLTHTHQGYEVVIKLLEEK